MIAETELAKQPPAASAGRKIEPVARAARQLFIEQGYSATSMEAIARAAGVSKATLYAYFPSKEALFASLIMTSCEDMTRALPIPDLSNGLTEALRTFARQYMQTFMEQKEVALVRTIANESGRFPELGRLFYESGPLATIRRLARFLEEARAQRLLEFDDAVVSATQFLSLVRGERPLLTVLGIVDRSSEAIDQEIEAGVQLFLRACRPTGPAEGETG
ncbi:MAG TPA: TetR/AcrR family transcriptional regulator [Bradyrhizobium sp.]|nr:TetR/AcrR family transcriptional regulator [Bradyrhizobium sp.]